METATSRPAVDASIDDEEVVALWGKVHSHLESERRRISQEIREYPTPITACDAQFNHLLEERARICEEVRYVQDAIESGRGCADTLALLGELVRSSRHLGEELRQEIDRSLAARHSEIPV